MKRPQKQIGLTMVELLVSLGIILILAVLLIAATGPIVKKAKAAQSAAVLRGVLSAIFSWSAENHLKIPRAIDWKSRSTPNPNPFDSGSDSEGPYYNVYWPEMLLPYIPFSAMICPARDPIVAWKEPMNWSYGLNLRVAPEEGPQLQMTNLKAKSNTYFIMAAGGYALDKKHVTSPTWIYYLPGAGLEGIDGSAVSSGPWPAPIVSPPDFNGRRFARSVPVGFLDGHVEVLPVKTLIEESKKEKGSWDPVFN